MIDSLAGQLSVYLLRDYVTIRFRDTGSGDSLTFQQTRLVRDYVQEHLHENISLQDLAGTLALSRFHFSRRFRNATGTTPHQFVLQQRIAHAQQLLRRSPAALSEVARSCGFADQSHMTRMFRQRLRMTPANSGASARRPSFRRSPCHCQRRHGNPSVVTRRS